MLEVHDLSTGYGFAEVLHGVSLEVNEGEIVAVVGANGAGKSTLLKAVSGLLPARPGSITFLGESITANERPGVIAAILRKPRVAGAFIEVIEFLLPRMEGVADRFLERLVTIPAMPPEDIVRRGIAHIPEGRRVFPHSTIDENLSAGAYVRSDADGVEADRRLYYERFPALLERKDKLASTLSGGEQQMLAICRGLMSRPRLILMDEPSLGLAPIMVDRVFEIVEELNREGKSILLVEQNATRALAIAHRAYVMVTGEIVLSGPGEELLDNEEVQRSYLGS